MKRHTGERQLVIFAAAYLTYFGVRAFTEGRVDRALANAASIVDLERWLGIAWEGAIQGVVAGSQALQDVVNAIYIYGHWPLIIGAGIVLFRYRREHYYSLRNVCLLTGALGLFIFALFPVAPPRLTDLPLLDTVTRGASGYRQILPPTLVNQYAAMPSFHAGWNLAVGVVVFRATRHWALRAFAVLMPAAMAFSVIATANHFVIDVVVGVTLVLIAFALDGRSLVPRAALALPRTQARQHPAGGSRHRDGSRGDERGVDGDGDGGAFAGGGDDLRARVGGVARRPHAGHARARVRERACGRGPATAGSCTRSAVG